MSKNGRKKINELTNIIYVLYLNLVEANCYHIHIYDIHIDKCPKTKNAIKKSLLERRAFESYFVVCKASIVQKKINK